MGDAFLKFFDTVAGMPLHPLVVHFAVAVSPLLALVVIWQLLRKRRGLWGPLAVVAALDTILLIVASASGEALASRVGYEEVVAAGHLKYADIAVVSMGLLFVALLFLKIWDSRRRRSWQWLRPVAVLLAWVACAGVLAGIFLTAEAGTKTLWHSDITETTFGTHARP